MSNRNVSMTLAAICLLAISTTAMAVEDVRVAEFYSNSCATRQFIELIVPRGNGRLSGREIRLFDHTGALTRTLTFTADVPDASDSRVLIATPGLAAAANVASDSVIPNLDAGDLDVEGGAIWFGCCDAVQDIDIVLYGNYIGPVPPTGTTSVTGGYDEPLPTNGPSVVRLFPQPDFDVAIPTPQNNSGDVGLLPATGDIDNDGDVDLVDAGLLATALVGNNTDAGQTARCDLNCSGALDGPDIPEMISLLTPESYELPPCTGIFEPYVSITYDPLNTFVPYTGPNPPATTFFTLGLTATKTPNVVIASAEGQLWASINDGCSWTSIATTDLFGHYEIEAGPLGYAYAWVKGGTGSGLDAGIYQIHNDPPGSAIFDVEFRPAPVEMYGFGVDRHNPHHIRTARHTGEIQESFDGGMTWRRIGVEASSTATTAYVTKFDPNDLDHMVYGRTQEGAFVTFDGGETWTQSTGLTTLAHRGANFFNATISPVDGNVVFGMSIDLGETGLPGDPPAKPSNGKHIYASTDGGLTFTPVLSRGTGGGEPGEGVQLNNGPTMKSDYENPTKFYYIFGTNCINGGTYFYGYDLTTGVLDTYIANEDNGCIPKPHQFEWSRTNPGALLMGFEFIAN